ncbi:hypothetical protein [Xylella fastidiosa]|nr:hypothetical protein [Xylella fastidiosa]
MPFKPTGLARAIYKNPRAAKMDALPDTHHGKTSWITQNPTTS